MIKRPIQTIISVALCAGSLLRADSAAVQVAPAGAATPPNIILILADDLGYGDCSVYHPASKINTPHIDQLAAEGLRFTDAHAAASTCTPSRYGLLTGTNPVRTGVLNTLLSRGDPIIAEDEKTLATLLRDQGYVTRMIGKWHLGFETERVGKKPAPNLHQPLIGGPLDRGFDSFYGLESSASSSPIYLIRDRRAVSLPTEKGTIGLYKEDRSISHKKVMLPAGLRVEAISPMLCQEALEVIRAQAASQDAKPLFLYYALPAPHQPWVPSAAFKGKSGLGDYADFVMQLDDVVGQINQALKDTGLDQNTLLIFTSDNGTGPPAVKVMAHAGHASSAMLRGAKADCWEGGHRVPFIAKWPGRIAANQHTQALVNFTDLFATLAELFKVDMHADYPSSGRDSHSFLSTLLQHAPPSKRPGMMFSRSGVRHGDWKLVSKARVSKTETLQLEQFDLYNLAQDIAERNDLSQSNPERANELFQAFQAYLQRRELK